MKVRASCHRLKIWDAAVNNKALHLVYKSLDLLQLCYSFLLEYVPTLRLKCFNVFEPRSICTNSIDKIVGLEMGADDYIIKPFREAIVRARVHTHLELKRYLRQHLYRHYRVLRMTTKARRVVRELFEAMLEEVELMPTEHQESARRLEMEDGRPGRARAVADYIAGMTDRFAILEYGRLFDPSERT